MARVLRRTAPRPPGSPPIPPAPPTPPGGAGYGGWGPWARNMRRAAASRLRRAQLELADEAQEAWAAVHPRGRWRPGGGSGGGGGAAGGDASSASAESLGDRLSRYRALIEQRAGLALLPGRPAAESRLVALLCSLELDPAAQRWVPTTLPAALADAWRRSDPSFADPRDRLGVGGASRWHRQDRAGGTRGPGVPWAFRTVQARSGLVERLVRGPLRHLAREAALAWRAAVLTALLGPALVTAPVAAWLPGLRPLWSSFLVACISVSGPALIKWGQWAATRPDLLPPDLCDALAQLHAGAPAHPHGETVRLVQAAFGRPLSYLFDAFEEEPLASGSIAQVHRAVLSRHGAAETGCPEGTLVAVKVRHPGVSAQMEQDFALMQRLAQFANRIEALRFLRLDESVRQFGAPMRAQLDLTTEAANLDRFNANFRRWPECWFPEPLRPLVTPDVLVETYETGESVMRYVDGRASTLMRDAATGALADEAAVPVNTAVCSIGTNLFLKMILQARERER